MECDLLLNNGSRAARQKTGAVTRALKSNGFNVNKTYLITRRYPLAAALVTVVKRHPKLLIVGGGDGTVSTVLGRLAGKKIDIGIIPLGTTNNFARSLGISTDIEDAINTIRSCKSYPVDLGSVNGMLFANVASFGVSAEVAQRVTDKAKRRWGRFAYAAVSMRQLWAHSAFSVRLEDVDRNLTVMLETHQMIIANGRYHAGKEVAEGAAIDNGQLIVFALGGPSKLSLIKHLGDFYLGRRRRVVHSSYFIGRHIRITTDRICTVEIDGEVKKKTPIVALVEKGAINVRYKR